MIATQSVYRNDGIKVFRNINCHKIIAVQIIAMQISIILAYPDHASFNHAIAQTVIEAIKVNGIESFFMIFIRKNSIRC
jgi:protoheme ferro-lyase